MKIFILGDPHFGRDMSRFGEVWEDHQERIATEWRRVVGGGDLVLIPGDFSWATTTKAIERHLELVNSLPGKCIISPGNHDRWWKKIARLRYSDIRYLADAHRPLGDGWTLAATMAWDSRESPWWKEDMAEDHAQSVETLENMLNAAHQDRPDDRILLAMHYPPRWDVNQTPTAYEEVIARYPVDTVVYGHIHGDDLRHAHDGIFEIGGRQVRYFNASCDRMKCCPGELMTIDSPDPQLFTEASEA